MIDNFIHVRIASSEEAFGFREQAGSLVTLGWRGRGLDRGSLLGHVCFAADATR